MAKRRIRTLLRQGWIEVLVPRKNLYDWDPANPDKPFGDDLYMQELISWCQERYDPEDYTYSMPPDGGHWGNHRRYDYDNCFKRFVFRKASDAMMFKLKWSE